MPVTGIITQIRTTDIDKSIDFYVDKLGLDVEFRYEDFYAGISAGRQIFHLKRVDDKDPSLDYVVEGDHFHLYFTTDDVEAQARNLKSRGVEFLHEIKQTPWGTKDFYILSDQGHVICYSQTMS